MKYFLASIIFLFCFSSCKVPDYAKEDKGKLCELHKLTLHPTVVKINYGFFCANSTRSVKGSELFPNARHPECGGCVVRPYNFVRIYTCSRCTFLKRKEIFRFKSKEERKKVEIRSKF